MTRRELTEDSSAPELWAEIYLLREALRGPDGFATWKDAAINERVRRVRAEAALRTAHPPKDAGELPPLPAKRRVMFCTPEPDSVREAFEPLAWHVEWPMPGEPRDQRWVKVCVNEADALDLQAKYPATIITPLCSLAAAQSRIASLEAERDAISQELEVTKGVFRNLQQAANESAQKWAEAVSARDEARARVASLEQAMREVLEFQSAPEGPHISEWGRWRRLIDGSKWVERAGLSAASTANQAADHG